MNQRKKLERLLEEMGVNMRIRKRKDGTESMDLGRLIFLGKKFLRHELPANRPKDDPLVKVAAEKQ